MSLVPCFNRGCGKMFNPAENDEKSCCHHPGLPFFHDAYKGWSCCNKKTVDFTEFLNIKGCTFSQHSNVKPPEPEKPAKTENSAEEVVVVREPIQPKMQRPPYETPLVTLVPTVAATLKQQIDNFEQQNQNKSAKANLESSAKEKIVVGTSCKNNSCTYAYAGTSADIGECRFHPGVPIFHEGMKYWSCCQKKTTDFAQFMAQAGCVSGQHKYIKDDAPKKGVECRYDWHQTATDVVVAIYAKMFHYAKSVVQLSPVRLRVSLVFPEKQYDKFDLDAELWGIVKVEQAQASMLSTKLEIRMPKAEAGSWAKLERIRIAKATETAAIASTTQHTANAESDDEVSLNDLDMNKANVGDFTIEEEID